MLALRLLSLAVVATAFQLRPAAPFRSPRAVSLGASNEYDGGDDGVAAAGGRRRFFEKLGGTASALGAIAASPSSASAIVFLDPARRVSVDCPAGWRERDAREDHSSNRSADPAGPPAMRRNDDRLRECARTGERASGGE